MNVDVDATLPNGRCAGLGRLLGKKLTNGNRDQRATSPRGEVAASVAWLQEGRRLDWRGRPRRRERNASLRLCDDGPSATALVRKETSHGADRERQV